MTASLTVQLLAIAALAVINIFYKGLAPAVLGDREFSPRVTAVLIAFGPALLAGLLVVEVLGAGWRDIDATVLPGLAAVAALRWRGVNPLLCIVAGVALTVAARSLV